MTGNANAQNNPIPPTSQPHSDQIIPDSRNAQADRARNRLLMPEIMSAPSALAMSNAHNAPSALAMPPGLAPIGQVMLGTKSVPTDRAPSAPAMPADRAPTDPAMPTDHVPTAPATPGAPIAPAGTIIVPGPIAQVFHVILGITAVQVAMTGLITIGGRSATTATTATTGTTAMTGTTSITDQAASRTRGVASIIGTRHTTGGRRITGAGRITAIPFGTRTVIATTIPFGLSGAAMFISRRP